MMLFARYRWSKSALALLLLFMLAGCQAELLTGLTQRQANETIALLLRNGLDVRKLDMGKGRFRIDVDRESFAEAVRLLDKYQLPSREDVTIADLFPADSFVNSPTTERARLISGLEQRLEQTVRAVDHVLSARVHISYPTSERTDPDQALHVSLMLNYDGALSEAILNQRLKQLVKNSFESLSYENISVVIFSVSAEQDHIAVQKGTVVWSGWRWSAIVGAALLPLLVAGSLVFLRRSRKENRPMVGCDRQVLP